MEQLLTKLNYKGQPAVAILNAPSGFVQQWQQTLPNADPVTILSGEAPLDFILAFVQHQFEIDALAPQIAPRLAGDGIVWFAYPKGTSKIYRCDFNRDTGWQAMKEKGFDTVRQIAIDADWTALRFRRIEYIKNAKRAVNPAII